MNRVVTMKVNGEDVQAREVDFEPVTEPWTEYRLLDGGAVRMKAFAVKIFQQVDSDGNPKFDNEGYPLMVIRHEVKIVSK